MEEARQQRRQEDAEVVEALVEQASCAEQEPLSEGAEQAIAHVAGLPCPITDEETMP